MTDATPNSVTLVGGQVLSRTHPPGKCAGEFCCIHNPSDHPMRQWVQQYTGTMWRISPDGDVYPDPDDPYAPEAPNAVECLRCGVILVSLHRHDYRTCECGTMVDGGNDYARRGWRGGTPEEAFREITEWPLKVEWMNRHDDRDRL